MFTASTSTISALHGRIAKAFQARFCALIITTVAFLGIPNLARLTINEAREISTPELDRELGDLLKRYVYSIFPQSYQTSNHYKETKR